jgi:hypothetical protein
MKRTLVITGLTALLVTVLAIRPILSQDVEPRSNGLLANQSTHLNVAVGRIVNLASFCILNDNDLDRQFFFDRQVNLPFVIPAGNSFVITDIFVDPSCDTSDPDSRALVVIEGPNANRGLSLTVNGNEVKHFPLAGGLAFRAGEVPQPRNTPSSSGRVEIQVLGYFVRGSAPPSTP